MNDGQQEQEAKRLQEQECTARLALFSEGQWALDARLRFVHAPKLFIRNCAIDATALLGLRPSAHRFKATQLVVQPAELVLLGQRLRTRQAFRDVELALLLPNGQLGNLAISGQPLLTNGVFTGYLGNVRDISREHDLLAELRLSKAQLLDRTVQLQAESIRRTEAESRVFSLLEEQQLRIAHELHDGVGQLLTGTSLLLAALDQQTDVSGHHLIARLKSITTRAIQQTQSLARGLNPVHIEPHGLAAALQQLADDLSTHTQADISAMVQPALHSVAICRINFVKNAVTDLTEHVATQLFRITQEAMTNALRHSGASQIDLTLNQLGSIVSISVRDNGRGMSFNDQSPQESGHSAAQTHWRPPHFMTLDKPLPSPRHGLGIASMRYRAKLIGAAFECFSELGKGTAIELKYIIPHAAMKALV